MDEKVAKGCLLTLNDTIETGKLLKILSYILIYVFILYIVITYTCSLRL